MKREENLKTAIKVMTALLVMVAVYFVLYGRSEQASSGKVGQEKKKPCVVIDAGHGEPTPVRSVLTVRWKKILIWKS